MPRLSEGDARRLAGALAGSARGDNVDPTPTQANAPDIRPREEAPQRLSALFGDSGALDELGRALTLDLASYLNRPVRCSVTQPGSPVANAWRYEALGQNLVWWLDLDTRLAGAFADAMIGGDGSGHVGHGRRVRALVEPLVARIFQTVAEAAGVEPPGSAFAAAPGESGIVIAGGLCAVAADQYGWQIGIRVAQPLAAAQPKADSPGTVWPATRKEAASATQPAAASATQPTAAPRASAVQAPETSLLLKTVQPGNEASPVTPYSSPAAGDDAVLRFAVESFLRHVQEVLRCQIGSTPPTISRPTGADLKTMPATSLGFALTAGGNGAVVAFLNADAVAAMAAGAVGAPIPPVESSGDVVLAAAEAIVRDALGEVARNLPGIASDAHRIVRLSDSPLPARTAHHAADVRFSIGGRAGTLTLLVPSWMLAPAGPSPT